MQSTLRIIGILISIGFLTGGPTLADDKGEPPRDPMTMMQNARELTRLGKHEEALKDLLWCFDEGAKGNPAFVGVRLSFLLSQIAELGKAYPPALDALRERRDAAKTRAMKTKGSSNYETAVMEWVSLNHSLGEDAANLELYDRLRAEAPHSSLVTYVQHFVAKELTKAGRVKEEAPAGAPMEEPDANRRRGPPERAWPRNPDEQLTENGNAASGVVYVIDQARFKRDLAASKDEPQRLQVLARRWNQIVLAVAHCDVARDMSFHSSLSYWRSGWLSTGTWTLHSDGDLVTPSGPMNKATALVRGDCRANITITGGGIVHVYGDLDATIKVSGQSNVVIGGDVKPNGCIEAAGIVRVFVGGDVQGRIRSEGSLEVWVHGDLDGEIRAGHPSTRVHITGDFRGDMEPLVVGGMTYLDVRGKMPYKAIQATARHGWTVFNASIGVSDMPPGLYPKSRAAHGFWVVHSQSP